ncbi:Uncharacterised protein [Klebsiella variicola]|nr:Uncharacterised protein [Klebsiella variicola]VEC94910.1 Uncharacterised protein [Klebsiella variicola]
MPPVRDVAKLIISSSVNFSEAKNLVLPLVSLPPGPRTCCKGFPKKFNSALEFCLLKILTSDDSEESSLLVINQVQYSYPSPWIQTIPPGHSSNVNHKPEYKSSSHVGSAFLYRSICSSIVPSRNLSCFPNFTRPSESRHLINFRKISILSSYDSSMSSKFSETIADHIVLIEESSNAWASKLYFSLL